MLTMLLISSLNVCMVKKYILYFAVTPCNFVIAKLSIRKPGSSSDIIRLSTDVKQFDSFVIWRV